MQLFFHALSHLISKSTAKAAARHTLRVATRFVVSGFVGIGIAALGTVWTVWAYTQDYSFVAADVGLHEAVATLQCLCLIGTVSGMIGLLWLSALHGFD